MAAELAGWLLRSTLALTLALAVLMPLRPLVRQLLGPGAVLWLWLLLPAALLATTLPRPASLPVPPARFATEAADATATATALVAPATVAIDAPAIAATDVPERASPAARDHSEAARGAAAAGSPVAGAAAVLRKAFAATPPSPHWLLAAWGLGAFAAAAYLYGQQRRYLRALGPLRRRRDGAWQARAAGLPPAVIGAFAPRIVLPADFDDRFEPAQRRLVLAHERVHLRRGDLQANLGLCVLRCLFWFHPLVHAAAARLRLDQELACDAQVLREHPGGARDYATALLNTQLAVPGLPVGCAWQSSHPLKWRIAMLKKPLHGPARLVPGVVLALAASSATAMSLWQVQPVAAAAPVATVAPAAAPSAAPVAIAAPA
ncbi:M56 family metallopeptidase, partial [Arenimonas composti]